MPFEEGGYGDAFRAAGSDHVDARYVPMVDICKRAIVNIMDPHLDIDDSDSSVSSSYAEPLPTALKRRTNRSSSSISIKKRKSTSTTVTAALTKSPPDSAESTDTDVDIITVDDDDFVKKVDNLRILPPTPPTSDTEIDVMVRNHTLSIPKPQVEKIKKPRQSSLSVLDPETGERKYVCAVEDCKKQYKNANGLKYHLAHAHPDGQGVPKEYLLFQKKKEEDGYRPYPCTVDGCEKKYKNLNGLKYHIEHYHSSLLPAAVAVTTPVGHPRVNGNIPYPISMLQQSTIASSIYTAIFPPAPGPQKGSQK